MIIDNHCFYFYVMHNLKIGMKDIDQKHNQTIRVIVVVSIMLTLAAIHWFRIGSYLSGDLYINYNSYASDLMLPFGAYFLLSMNEIQLQFLRKWYAKVLIVFCVMTFSEIMQLFGGYVRFDRYSNVWNRSIYRRFF